MALEDFQKALELRPNYFKSFLNRANVLADLKMLDEAILDYTKGIELQPRFFKAFSNRGHLYHETGQWDLALSDFQCAIYIDPEYVNSLFNLGILYLDMTRQEDAMQCFTRAVEIDPTDADCWAYTADIHFSRREFGKSIEKFTYALEHDYSARYLYNRALSFLYSGAFENAIEDIDDYFGMQKPLEPDEELTADMFFYIRGSSLLALGDFEEALDEFTRGAAMGELGSQRRWFSRRAACHKLAGRLDACLNATFNWGQVWAMHDEFDKIANYVEGVLPQEGDDQPQQEAPDI